MPSKSVWLLLWLGEDTGALYSQLPAVRPKSMRAAVMGTLTDQATVTTDPMVLLAAVPAPEAAPVQAAAPPPPVPAPPPRVRPLPAGEPQAAALARLFWLIGTRRTAGLLPPRRSA